ncbi:MAG: choice-of-anchor L domain-containing protein, partial [Bacteroidia bacterium]
LSKIATLFILLNGSLYSFAQLTVNNSQTPAQLVQNVLLGPGVTASNITYSGSNLSRGQFSGTSNLGLASGVILATGNISVAPGPNNSGSSSADGSGVESNDPELNSISTNTLYDAAILEFDFVPLSDTIKFRYVFGSEEYMEFANSSYNDVFGFFISGPNPSGGNYTNQNIALIPNSSTPVTINNVNGNFNSTYYFDNENPPGTSVQYDGFTVPLTATAIVTCGETYHIKIAIADAGDSSFDSGVFLEAESFSSPGVSIIPQISYGGQNDSTLYEGCGTACILLVRGGTLLTSDTVNLVISGTAINGTDYYETTGGIGTPFPNQIVFAPGVDSVSFCITAASDMSAEGLENLILTVPAHTVGLCVQPEVSTTIYIDEYIPLSVSTIEDTVLCNSLTGLVLNTSVNGGVQPYSFAWTNGASPNANPTVNPTENTSYIVTVNDACSGAPDPTPAVSDTVNVSIVAIPLITTTVSYQGTNDSVFYEGCGQACVYFVRAVGITQAATYSLNITGTAQNGVDFTPALPSQLTFAPGQDSIFYCLQATVDGAGEISESIILSIDTLAGACSLNETATLYVNEYTPITLTTINDTTLCNALTSVTLNTIVTGGVAPYTYSWTGGASPVANPTVSPTANTTYIVTVNDACAGTPDPTPAVIDTVNVSIISIPAITATVSYQGSNTPIFYEGCGQACVYFVRTIGVSQAATFNLNVSGTAINGTDYTPALPTQLSFAPGQDSLFYCLEASADGSTEIPESILLTIDTVLGTCNLSASTSLTINEVGPLVVATYGDTTFNCNPSSVNIGATVTGGLQPYTYTWSNNAGSVASQILNPSTTTTYTVTVADACIATTDPTPDVTQAILITVNIPTPIVVTASDDANACPDDNIALFATATGGVLPLTYLWTNVGPDSVLFPNQLNTSLVASATTVFTITVTDDCGNTQADQVTVNVEENCLLNIPNVITPDGKGPVENEMFYIQNLNRYPPASLLIFNRFGNKIFESTNYLNDWTGSKYSDGTYFFVLTVPAAGTVPAKVKPDNKTDSYQETVVGTDKVYSGFFQIIRSK